MANLLRDPLSFVSLDDIKDFLVLTGPEDQSLRRASELITKKPFLKISETRKAGVRSGLWTIVSSRVQGTSVGVGPS